MESPSIPQTTDSSIANETSSADSERNTSPELTSTASSESFDGEFEGVPNTGKSSTASVGQQPTSSRRSRKAGPAIGSAAWMDQYVTNRLANRINQSSDSQAQYLHLAPTRVLPIAVPDKVEISISNDARVIWDASINEGLAPLFAVEQSGIASQPHQNNSTATDRELTIGFDFGTSSVKVVVSDAVLEQSFAIPFRDAIGIDAYLLPSRLFEQDGVFSLSNMQPQWTGVVHRDLKLALLDSPENSVVRHHVVAFLALAIRKVRAWFFSAHGDAYRNASILWTLAIGVPADLADQAGLLGLYASLGKSAWYVAGREGSVTEAQCEQANAAVEEGALGDEVDVHVMPELAAQIQGFLTSSQFDPKASNLYLIADVGAGTVDSCLLHVGKTLAGSFRFNLYTTVVETRGVMNLHRHRMTWWLDNLPGIEGGQRLNSAIGTFQLPTDQLKPIPETFTGYFDGVKVSFSGKEISPDAHFKSGLLQQVQGKTAYRAYREGKLVEKQVSNARSILCGGGSRMDYYKELSRALGKKPHGFSWLAMRPMALVMPHHLRADGVADRDFDRLSVAYGLSTLQMESMEKMLPQPKERSVQPNGNWWMAYVDKDQT